MNTTNFWAKLPLPFSVLAPMEDVTDIVFRHVVARAARPDVFVTEFTNTASFCSEQGNFSTVGRLAHDAGEAPIVAQIWGTEPAHFATMSHALREQGFNGIDINMGCPAKDVVKIGAGSGMIGNCQLAQQIIAATKEGGLPVSVKTRLGRTRVAEYRDWITFLLSQKLACLTVHLRTRKEMSKVPAHYELISELVSLRDRLSPPTRLVINGDIADYARITALHHQYPGVDGCMIGRGVFANPFCFDRSGGPRSRSELFDLFLYHLDQYDKYRLIMPAERPELVRNFDSLKHFFKIYVNGFAGASDLRARLYACTSTDEIRQVLAEVPSHHGT